MKTTPFWGVVGCGLQFIVFIKGLPSRTPYLLEGLGVGLGVGLAGGLAGGFGGGRCIGGLAMGCSGLGGLGGFGGRGGGGKGR